jgi:hypothetical protein
MDKWIVELLPPPKDRPIKIVRRMDLEQEVDGL